MDRYFHEFGFKVFEKLPGRTQVGGGYDVSFEVDVRQAFKYITDKNGNLYPFIIVIEGNRCYEFFSQIELGFTPMGRGVSLPGVPCAFALMDKSGRAIGQISAVEALKKVEPYADNKQAVANGFAQFFRAVDEEYNRVSKRINAEQTHKRDMAISSEKNAFNELDNILSAKGAVKNTAKSLSKGEPSQTPYILFMAISSIVCILTMLNIKTFYRILSDYPVSIAVLFALPVVVFALSLRKKIRKKTGLWITSSMTTYFSCLLLWPGSIASSGYIMIWLGLAFVLFILFCYLGTKSYNPTWLEYLTIAMGLVAIIMSCIIAGIWRATGSCELYLQWAMLAPSLIMTACSLLANPKE